MMNRQLADVLHNATEFVLHVVDEVGRRTGLDKLEFGSVSRISDRSRTQEVGMGEEMVDEDTEQWQPPSTIWPIEPAEATVDVRPPEDDAPGSQELLDLPEIKRAEETDEEVLEVDGALLDFPDEEPLDEAPLLEFLDEEEDEEIALSRTSDTLLEFLAPGTDEARDAESIDFLDAEADTTPSIRLTRDELGTNMAREMLFQASGGDPNDDPLDHLHPGTDPLDLIAIEEDH